MRLRKIAFSVLCSALVLWSCNNDDDGLPQQEPLATFEEQQAIDDEAIQTYLRTHSYNASAFAAGNTSRIEDLVITEFSINGEAPEGSVRLIDAVTTETLVIDDITLTYYILNLNQGVGTNAPTFADRIRVQYQGQRLSDGDVFDDQLLSPTTFDLTGTIIGWQNVFPNFNAAENFVTQDDGVVNFVNPGVGVMFLPSTMAYFNFSQETANLFREPLIFKFELLQVFQNDTDEDGIPSYLEDLNADGIFNLEGTEDNTDGDSNPNVDDADDDNDGVLTQDEITVNFVEAETREAVENTSLTANQVLARFIEEVRNEAGEITAFRGRIITFFDTDGDGVFNHLDADDAINVNDEI